VGGPPVFQAYPEVLSEPVAPGSCAAQRVAFLSTCARRSDNTEVRNVAGSGLDNSAVCRAGNRPGSVPFRPLLSALYPGYCLAMAGVPTAAGVVYDALTAKEGSSWPRRQH
jgi:hypothetical protein